LIKRIADTVGIKVKYAVVDGASSCESGNKFFNSPNDISFFDFRESGVERARKFLGRVDVCNISGTLHYIPDWRPVLRVVRDLNPYVVCISRAATPDCSDVEGYVIQHVTSSLGYCGDIKVVLIPRNMLISEMKLLGMELVSQQGNDGDGNWFWGAGCSDSRFYKQTHRQFLFINKHQ